MPGPGVRDMFEVFMHNVQSVVVPIDFETQFPDHRGDDFSVPLEPGEHAVTTQTTVAAIRFAAELVGDGLLHLVHVTPHLGAFSHYGGSQGAWLPLETAQQLEQTARQHAELALQTIAEHVCPDARRQLHVGPGKAYRVILDFAAEVSAGAIVLAGSGRGPLRRALGSTADHVMRGASCPVVVIPTAVRR